MSDPTSTGFIPKWLRDQPLDEAEPHFQTGSVPDQDPRVVTRLMPKDHGYSLPAQTVSRVIDLKQALAFHAARDVVDGFNPNFADLTSLTKTLREAATLALEPAEPGSYIIPARLPVRFEAVSADAVIARYAELLAFIFDRENAPRPTYRMTPATVKRLDQLLINRRVTNREFKQLTGRLEALDLGKNEFQLKIDGHLQRVKGTAAFFSLTSLREQLGETVTLKGDVVRDRKSITMTAYRVIESDDE